MRLTFVKAIFLLYNELVEGDLLSQLAGRRRLLLLHRICTAKAEKFLCKSFSLALGSKVKGNHYRLLWSLLLQCRISLKILCVF